MIQDSLTRDQRIALESVAQAIVSMGIRVAADDQGFNTMMERAAAIESFIRGRGDVEPGTVPVLRDGDMAVVQPDRYATEADVDQAVEIWRQAFGDRVRVTFMGWPVTAIHRPSTGNGPDTGTAENPLDGFSFDA